MADFFRSAPSIKATIIGQSALLIWSLSACCVVYFDNIPPFQILSGIFLSGFIASSIMNSARDNWKAVATRPKYLLIVGVSLARGFVSLPRATSFF